MYFNLENESLCWLITKYYLIRSSVIKCQFLFFVEIMHAFFFFFFFFFLVIAHLGLILLYSM